MSSLNKTVDTLASQCVKCGLCLPHCPTYELTHDENESPRGRIALFQALAKEQLPLDGHVKKHLDQCLGCRACERVCPAHVAYGELLTDGRGMLETLKSTSTLPKHPLSVQFLSFIATKPKLLRQFHWLLWLLQISGLRRLGEILGLTRLFGLKKLDQLLPEVDKPLSSQTLYPSTITPAVGQVNLFTGCISSLADQRTLEDTIFVLNRLGYEVKIPAQNCCGAIALHAGDLAEAKKLAEENIKGFDINTAMIMNTATGCGAVLKEYKQHFSLDSTFSERVEDIVSFLLKQPWAEAVALKPLNYRVLVHTPCTRRNVLKTPLQPEQLLTKIPQLQIKTMNRPHCCGAAGTYMLEHADMAVPLAQQLLEECKNEPVDVIATTNIGCALHLHQQLQTMNPNIRVCHPITLLAESLGI